MRKVLLLTSLLAVQALSSGCDKNIASIVDVSLVCPSWKEVTLRKGDVLTDRTAQIIEGNNEARLAQGCSPDPQRVNRKKAPAKAKPQKPGALTS